MMIPFAAGLSARVIVVGVVSSVARAQCPHPFFDPPLHFEAGNEPFSVALGDLDGDGDLDMAVANRDSDDVSVLLNNGDGTLAAAVAYAAGDDPNSVAIGDLDGDGHLDMAVANGGGSDVSVLLNQGDFCPADLDGNGTVDFADLLTILSAWGQVGGPEDLNGNGSVDFADILAVIGGWGPCS